MTDIFISIWFVLVIGNSMWFSSANSMAKVSIATYRMVDIRFDSPSVHPRLKSFNFLYDVISGVFLP